MKKLLAILSFTFLLSSCASNDVVLPVMDEASTVQAQAKNTDVEKNLFEKIEPYYAKPTPNSLSAMDGKISQMLVKVKSLTGQQKYDNGRTVSKYYLYVADELFAHGTVRFGKDGKLYFEDYLVDSGSYQYCEIGTYTKAPSIKDGENVSIKLNNNFKMVFKGQGLNPMAHNKIYIKTNSDANVKPVKKAPEEFI